MFLTSILRRFSPPADAEPTFRTAAREVEAYLVESMGWAPEYLMRELRNPDALAELERRVRQLLVWVQLLHDTDELYHPLARRHRKRKRQEVKRAFRELTDFHADHARAFSRRLDRTQRARLIYELHRCLTHVRARLLNVMGRTDVPFSDRLRFPPEPGACTPPSPAAHVEERPAAVADRTPQARRVLWALPDGVSGSAERALSLCLQTIGLPADSVAEDPSPARPWS